MDQLNRIFAYLQTYVTDVDLLRAKVDVETLMDRIKLYCNISVIPEALERIIAQELYKLYTREETRGLKEFKQGDTTYTYATPGDFDTMILNMKLALFPFRRVYI